MLPTSGSHSKTTYRGACRTKEELVFQPSEAAYPHIVGGAVSDSLGISHFTFPLRPSAAVHPWWMASSFDRPRRPHGLGDMGEGKDRSPLQCHRSHLPASRRSAIVPLSNLIRPWTGGRPLLAVTLK
uniref:Uncharacterized protein n=1 Tax=Plectus sambesii TaxID=2011161 RepID=A0A914XGT9_9BILA